MEARKCDRCHNFYDIPNEQQGKDKPYDFKGDYIKLLKVNNRRDYPETTRWYDLCPKCVEELEEWLINPEFHVPTLGKVLREEALNAELNCTVIKDDEMQEALVPKPPKDGDVE